MKGNGSDEKGKSGGNKGLLGRVFVEARTEGFSIALGSVALLASSLCNQAVPRLIGRMIDQKSSSNSTSSSRSDTGVAMVSWSALGVVLGGGLASFLRTTLLGRAQDKIESRLRTRGFESLMTKKDIEWFQTEQVEASDESKAVNTEEDSIRRPGVSPATIGTVLNDDVSRVSKVLTQNLSNLIRSSSAVLFSSYHMISLNLQLFGVALSIVPVVGAAAMLLRKSVKRVTEQQMELATAAASFVEERLVHIGLVRLSNRQEDEVAEYASIQRNILSVAERASIQNGLFMGFIFIASAGTLSLVVNLGGKSVASGRMTSGQLTSFVTYSFLLGIGTSGIVKAMGEFSRGMMSAERYYRLVDSDDETDDTNLAVVDHDATIDVSTVESVKFEDVSFSYKSTASQALKGISLNLQRGKVVALVGENGSGKSTLAHLLAGLYQPTSGRIVLSDGTDLSRVEKTSRQKLVQVIPQANALFNKSILENVRYGNPNASELDVKRALKLANCDDLVSRLEGGVHFVVGINGCKLSGGEQQRVALARALLSDPLVLVMDEPASSLDAAGESAVTEVLRGFRASDRHGTDRALLLISHQAKSLEYVDSIVVLKDGVIVESGTLESLRNRPNSELCRVMPELS